MELIVKSRNGKVSDHYRAYIEEKIGKLGRFLNGDAKVTVELYEEQRRKEGPVYRAQATLVGEHGILLRSDQTSHDMHVVIDETTATLQRQVQRYKDKHWRRGRLRRQNGQFVEGWVSPVGSDGAGDGTADDSEPVPRIVRTKEFQIKPMFSDEAVEQMELLGHSFFVFQDADTSLVNVLYRRSDGNYGLIVADASE